MSEGKNGQQLGAQNLQRFRMWIKEHDQAKDWADYWRNGKLIRTEITAECGFATAALRQNPAIKLELEALEKRLRAEMAPEVVIGEKTAPTDSKDVVDPVSSEVYTRRLRQDKSSAEKRIKTLEEENAALRAQVSMLREQNRRYAHIDKYLEVTGRMVRP